MIVANLCRPYGAFPIALRSQGCRPGLGLGRPYGTARDFSHDQANNSFAIFEIRTDWRMSAWIPGLKPNFCPRCVHRPKGRCSHL